MDEKNQEINESNASKRLRMLGENMDEKIHSEEDEIKKGNLWHNIWYRYKWAIIIGILLLVTTIPIIIMCARAEEEDVLIMYVGPAQIVEGSTHSSLQSTFESIMPDYNGDNKKVLQIATHTVYPNGYVDSEGNGLSVQESGRNQENLNNFKQQLMSGELTIVLIDEKLYNQEFKNGFEKLSNLGINVPKESKYDECAIRLKDTEFGSYFSALDALPDDTLVVINIKNINHDTDEYNNRVDYLKALVEYKKPE